MTRRGVTCRGSLVWIRRGNRYAGEGVCVQVVCSVEEEVHASVTFDMCDSGSKSHAEGH